MYVSRKSEYRYIGNISNWAMRPKTTALGAVITRLKSSRVSPSPMPNIIIKSARGKKIVVKKLDSIEVEFEKMFHVDF